MLFRVAVQIAILVYENTNTKWRHELVFVCEQGCALDIIETDILDIIDILFLIENFNDVSEKYNSKNLKNNY